MHAINKNIFDKTLSILSYKIVFTNFIYSTLQADTGRFLYHNKQFSHNCYEQYY